MARPGRASAGWVFSLARRPGRGAEPLRRGGLPRSSSTPGAVSLAAGHGLLPDGCRRPAAGPISVGSGRLGTSSWPGPATPRSCVLPCGAATTPLVSVVRGCLSPLSRRSPRSEPGLDPSGHPPLRGPEVLGGASGVQRLRRRAPGFGSLPCPEAGIAVGWAQQHCSTVRAGLSRPHKAEGSGLSPACFGDRGSFRALAQAARLDHHAPAGH